VLDISVPLDRKMTTSKAKITVIIAAYNEEEAIGQVVLGFKQELERSSYPFEILVVDNNSIDNTSNVAKTAGATVIKEELQGYGYACMKGLTEAQGEYIILTEGDKTFEPSDIWKLLVYLQEDDIDLALGTRTTLELVDEGAKMNWFLHWGNIFLAKMIQIQFWKRCRLTDVGCTFRAIKKSSLDKILPKINVGGTTFSPAMIIFCLKAGLKTVEVPVRYRKRLGESKITANYKKSINVGLRMLKLILSQRFW